jgi:cathepsin A (carboxypeptidase C)
MKLSAATLLLQLAAASAQKQQVLSNPFKGQDAIHEAAKPIADAWSKSLGHLVNSMKDMTAEAKSIFEEVAMLFPEAMDKASFISPPKPHTRKPDSAWEYVVKGADVQSVWVENADGQKEREIDGKLDTYNLRAKKVSPDLGVDKVKQ